MPSVRKSNPVIAIATSDWHLSENAPVARSVERDWWSAMLRPMQEIAGLAEKHDCPILLAGDLFDRWDCKPALLNFCLENLPHQMLCIPGNHDTPFHNPELIGQSAYWTMVCAERINDCPNKSKAEFYNQSSCVVYPFPFNVPISPPKQGSEDLRIALIHDYCHSGPGTAYADAHPAAHVTKFNLKGYDVAVFGDNHVNFLVRNSTTNVINCGTTTRRKANEIKYKPAVGLIRANGTIDGYRLDCSQDKFIDNAEKLAEAEAATGLDLTGFAEELRELAAAGLDFRDALRRAVGDNKVSNQITKIIFEAAGL